MPEKCDSLIKDRRFFLNLGFKETTLTALVDTGATNSFLGNYYWTELRHYEIITEPVKAKNVTVANCQCLSIIGKLTIPMKIGNVTKIITFKIVPTLQSKPILGIDMLRKDGVILDFKNDILWLADWPSIKYSMDKKDEKIKKPKQIPEIYENNSGNRREVAS